MDIGTIILVSQSKIKKVGAVCIILMLRKEFSVNSPPNSIQTSNNELSMLSRLFLFYYKDYIY